MGFPFEQALIWAPFLSFFCEDGVALQNYPYGGARAPVCKRRPCFVKTPWPSKDGFITASKAFLEQI